MSGQSSKVRMKRSSCPLNNEPTSPKRTSAVSPVSVLDDNDSKKIKLCGQLDREALAALVVKHAPVAEIEQAVHECNFKAFGNLDKDISAQVSRFAKAKFKNLEADSITERATPLYERCKQALARGYADASFWALCPVMEFICDRRGDIHDGYARCSYLIDCCWELLRELARNDKLSPPTLQALHNATKRWSSSLRRYGYDDLEVLGDSENEEDDEEA